VYETGEWDLIIRPKIAGDPSDFAWVVPFPVMPDVHPAPVDENFFKDLDDMTTTYFIEENCEYYCSSGGGVGCGGMAGDESRNSDLNTGKITVWESGQVGVFEYVILSSADGESLMTWLAEHAFHVSTKAGPIIDELAREGQYFFAARVNMAAALTRYVSGVGFSMPGSVAPFYPMRLTAAAGTERVGFTLWVLDEAGRSWVPSNYPWDVIEGGGSAGDELQQETYESRAAEILSAGQGDGFIIQYSTDSAQAMSCESFHGYYIYYYDLSNAACRQNWVPSAEMQRVLDWGTVRMHAEIPPSSLTRDVELRAAGDGELAGVVTWYWWPCQGLSDPETHCLEEKYSYDCSAAAGRGPRGAGAVLFLLLVLSAAALFVMTRRFSKKG
jgi:hypothetical protein